MKSAYSGKRVEFRLVQVGKKQLINKEGQSLQLKILKNCIKRIEYWPEPLLHCLKLYP